jgi:o-succinylbenzoate synthase
MSEIRHTPISIDLRDPLVTARATIFRRRGFLLGIPYNGKRYVSEVTLLPEFGTEHFEHAERILEGESMMLHSAPACVFGLDALHHAMEVKDDKEIRVPITKLLPSGSNKEIIDAARQAALESFDTVKLKVGYRKLEEDIALVNTLALELPELVLRLDANLGWSQDDVITFAKALPREAVEWIEDPCRVSMDLWHALQEEVGIPFACDEAFREQDILAHDGDPGFKALIIKPGRMGSLNERRPLLEKMRKHEIPVVMSSMFDTSVGLAHLAHLATHWSTLEIAQGLGTLHMLKNDVMKPGLTVEAGHLVVPPLHELAERLLPKYARALDL